MIHCSQFRFACYFLLLAFVLAGCTTSTIQPTLVATSTATPTPELPEIIVPPEYPTSTSQPTRTATLQNERPSPTPLPDVTESLPPTPDLRLSPEDWQSWPIVPTRVSNHMREVYLQGLSLGNNPHAFSKVGDCQNITAAFLGFFDLPRRYTLRDQYQPLQSTIDYFAGSFGRESQAVRGGFNVASVLSPLWADLEVCQKGETPLECEFRLHKPSIVFISMETWFAGRTPEVYAGYLRKIVDFTLQHGAVPILATKADNVEGDHSINLTIAQVAYEYDVPLWNFWLAVQPLPDHGIDWARDSQGFHITVKGWNVRSFTALQALDAVWKELNNGAVIQPEKEPTQVLVTATTELDADSGPVLTPLPSLQQTPASETTGRLLFSLAQRETQQDQHSGIFLMDLNTGNAEGMTGSGYRLLGLSPDGTRVLTSLGSRLWSMDLTGGRSYLLSESFFTNSATGAIWLPSGNQVAYIARQGDRNALLIAEADGSSITSLPTERLNPIRVYDSPNGGRLYWEAGQCDVDGNCTPQGVHWNLLDGSEVGELPGFTQAVFSSDGKYGASVEKSPKGLYRLHVFSLENSLNRIVLESEDYPTQIAWSPDGRRLLVIGIRQSDYSGRILGYRYHLFSAPDFVPDKIPSEVLGASSNVIWSPDGHQAAFLGINSTEYGNRLTVKLLNVSQQTVEATFEIANLWGGPFIYLSGLAWLP